MFFKYFTLCLQLENISYIKLTYYIKKDSHIKKRESLAVFYCSTFFTNILVPSTSTTSISVPLSIHCASDTAL